MLEWPHIVSNTTRIFLLKSWTSFLGPFAKQNLIPGSQKVVQAGEYASSAMTNYTYI